MDKKAIQRKRMERYLIDAAKSIIRDEGVEAVTVRKVADLAGYSYATLYNYFSDVNELLWYVAADYLDEMVERLVSQGEKSGPSPQGLKEIYRTYINFYLDNPTVYRFVFFKQMGEPPAEVAKKMSAPVLGEKQMEVLLRCAEEGYLAKEDIQAVGEMITIFVHGLLLFYFAERMQFDQEEMFMKMERAIDMLLRKKEQVR